MDERPGIRTGGRIAFPPPRRTGLRAALPLACTLLPALAPGIPAAAQTRSASGSAAIPLSPAFEKRLEEARQFTAQGNKLLEQGDVEAALRSYQRSTEIVETPSGWWGLARCYLQNGEFAQADAAFRRFVSRDAATGEYRVNGPRSVHALMHYAVLKSRMQRPQEAIDLYHAGLRHLNVENDFVSEPVPLTVVFVVADAVAETGGPTPYSPRLLEAAAHTAMVIDDGMYGKEALAHADAAVQSAPGMAIAHFYRGLTLNRTAPNKPEYADALRTALNSAGEDESGKALRSVATLILEKGAFITWAADRKHAKAGPRDARARIALLNLPPPKATP